MNITNDQYFEITHKDILSKKDFFLARIKKDGCWIWIGSRSGRGYGSIKVNGKKIVAHRFSYFLFNGFLDKNKFICHKCDVLACVNPDHLWAGTQSENILDCRNKGRLVNNAGANNGRSKLTEKKVKRIRRLFETKKYTHQQIADKFNVTRENVSTIIRRDSWYHI